jgi:hypothetical protein
MATTLSEPTIPKPKRKQIRLTTSVIQQQRVDDLKAKRQKSEVHKAALCLYNSKKQKPDCLLIRQVQAAIKAKYEVCLSKTTISHYAKQGLVNASQMKMGPVSHILAEGYKFLCQACSSLVPINQMNMCAVTYYHKMMILMLVKTFNSGTGKARGLFNRFVCNTATKINAEKLNCAEDCCIRWTTYQNLDLSLYPGVPNMTVVTQEMDQSYGLFQSAVQTNLQLIINKCICTNVLKTLLPWIVGLTIFGGEDPETGLIVGLAFQHGFSHAQNILAWEKVGAVPLCRKCLSSPKVRRLIGDGNNKSQALVHLIIENNAISCDVLMLEGYNEDMMKIRLKPNKQTHVITTPNMHDWFEILSQAKTNSMIFAATSGGHLMENDIF